MKNYITMSKNDTFELLNNHGLSIRFLSNGTLSHIKYHNLMINLYEGTWFETNVANIYLRIFHENKIEYYPLINNNSIGKFSVVNNIPTWQGNIIKPIKYKVQCHLSEQDNTWLWDIQIHNQSSNQITYDIVFIQDIGIANTDAVRTNEAYTSQYIDHSIIEHPQYGKCIASRQNMPQNVNDNECYPWLINGALEPITHILSDGFQFYGLSYKENNHPIALTTTNLPNIISQYELSCAGLQTERHNISTGDYKRHNFYTVFEVNHKVVTNDDDLKYIVSVEKFAQQLNSNQYIESTTRNQQQIEILNCRELDKNNIGNYFGNNLRHLELVNNDYLSFFYSASNQNSQSSRHVVLKKKELLSERPHGHIIFSDYSNDFTKQRLSSTNYMFGVFNSQITYGNTSFNKLISVNRTHLNIHKYSGQRIFFIDENGNVNQLGVPSCYEMGVNSARWIYCHEKGTIIVKTWSDINNPIIYLTIDSDIEYQFYITNHIVAGINEDDSFPIITITNENQIKVKPSSSELVAQTNPNSGFVIDIITNHALSQITDLSWSAETLPETSQTYVTIMTNKTSYFAITIQGYHEEPQILPCIIKENNIIEFENQWQRKLKYFKLEHPTYNEVTKYNDLMYWYLHNALVHLLVPHGLEQYSGAAWGTRDVCQGPVELLLSLGDFATIRQILLTLFSHQYYDNGNWPQWFMFDQFYKIQQHESHGDVIVWPLKALTDYIKASDDYQILTEKIPFSLANGSFTDEKYTLLNHIQKELAYIKDHFIVGTYLSCYGDGDWDDTLQPASASLRKSMVSGWTVQLTYQTLNNAGLILLPENKNLAKELTDLAKQILDDYNKYIIQDKTVAGFVVFNDDGCVKPLLHPSDTTTGIKYRLLPMTRGVISELFTKEQALYHHSLIQEHLSYSDGVRLMNTPATYCGGVNKLFKRAEQAASVGREVGLQYVHAHIRYIESLAKLGYADKAWRALAQINPILIHDTVKTAELRQSNSYFSSSDANFHSRYNAQNEWHKLKEDQITVRGGWRIYSSGPGIYINQLLQNCLGIRIMNSKLEIDPVITPKLNGLRLSLFHNNYQLVFEYIVANDCGVKQIVVNNVTVDYYKVLHNPYRQSGVEVRWSELEKLLTPAGNNIIKIYL